MKDLLNRTIVLPKVGETILRDGYEFKVRSVLPHKDLGIVATINLIGLGGEIEIGYYDYMKLSNFNKKSDLKYEKLIGYVIDTNAFTSKVIENLDESEFYVNKAINIYGKTILIDLKLNSFSKRYSTIEKNGIPLSLVLNS